MTPNYLSELFVKADTPYDTRDKFKLIQPLKRTTTYGLRSFQYYGAHVWNMFAVNMKATQIVARADMFMSVMCCIIMINANPLYHTLGGGGWRCDDYGFLWYRGLSLWQPVVPPLVVGSLQWQLLSVQCLVYIPCKYRPATKLPTPSSLHRWSDICRIAVSPVR